MGFVTINSNSSSFWCSVREIPYNAQMICSVARSRHQINKTMSIKENNRLSCRALKHEAQLESIARYRDVMTQVHNTVRGTFQNTALILALSTTVLACVK